MADPTADSAARGTRDVPSKCFIKSLRDDDDGIGFILETMPCDGADAFEIDRGIATDAADMSTIPAFTHFCFVSVNLFEDKTRKC